MSKTKVEIYAPENIRSIATLTIVELQTGEDRRRLSIARHGTGEASSILDAVTDSIERSLREDPRFEFPKQ